MRRLALLFLLVTGFATKADAQQMGMAAARLVDQQGKEVGHVKLFPMDTKGVMLQIEVSGLTPGAHGVHIHSVGRCEPPSFESAGAHFNPTNRTHGAHSESPKHAGDVGNLQVPQPGRIESELLARGVTLADGAPNSLFDADGSAIVIHAGPDDNTSQPSGNSGAPIVCGVIQR
jgi:Cu-Zn family superoxide dismutase